MAANLHGYARYPLALVAPAAIATSVVGVAAFQVLAVVHGGGTIAPDWPIGLALGVGGIGGSYRGASIKPHVSERAFRAQLGAPPILIAAPCLADALA